MSILGNIFGPGTKQASVGSSFIVGRVTKVVYSSILANGQPDPDYTNPTDIGTIRFVNINSTEVSSATGPNSILAKPLNSSTTHLPLEGEYVYIIPGPSVNFNESFGKGTFYYLPPYNVWSSNHHNALPNLDEYANYIGGTQPTNAQVEAGQVTDTQPSDIKYPLGNGFNEKQNIKNLRPFVGDIITEGRWGNSIRFGSTLTSARGINTWSSVGEDGDPILIIRNGQGNQSNNIGFVPIVEDINRDDSSIYLTAGQVINIEDINVNFSLLSFGVGFQANTPTVSIQLDTPLTTNIGLSAEQQDLSQINAGVQ
jgi:hypothetical protein